MPVKPLPRADLDHVLTHTRGLWDGLYGKSFFITGGTGFFGMWILESFAHINGVLNLGSNATVLTRDPTSFAEKAPHLAYRSDVKLIQGDIRSFDFPQGDFEYLIHAATDATIAPGHHAQLESLHASVSGMSRVLEFAAAAKVRKLLFTSSGAVYGSQPPQLTHIPEDFGGTPDCLNPGAAYGEGKRVAELMAAIHAKDHETEIKIARCFAFSGPHLPLNSNFAVGNFLRDGITGTPIRITGDGTPVRSYLYAADLVVWLWTILFNGKPLRPYNVGSEVDVTISRLASIVKASLGSKLPIEIALASQPGNRASRYVPSTVRARTELGLSELVGLPESIIRTARWHSNQRL
jgi:nucleoside-diphosphate-sugar epimerase